MIGPPETPAVFMLFLNWQMNQQMRSAFLVFDLIGGNTGVELKCNARRFIRPELNDREEAVGLIVREKSEPSSGGQSFAKGNGRIRRTL